MECRRCMGCRKRDHTAIRGPGCCFAYMGNVAYMGTVSALNSGYFSVWGRLTKRITEG